MVNEVCLVNRQCVFADYTFLCLLVLVGKVSELALMSPIKYTGRLTFKMSEVDLYTGNTIHINILNKNL
jgi:hypothetical protein